MGIHQQATFSRVRPICSNNFRPNKESSIPKMLRGTGEAFRASSMGCIECPPLQSKTVEREGKSLRALDGEAHTSFSFTFTFLFTFSFSTVIRESNELGASLSAGGVEVKV
jgi:hypothetical protein